MKKNKDSLSIKQRLIEIKRERQTDKLKNRKTRRENRQTERRKQTHTQTTFKAS